MKKAIQYLLWFVAGQSAQLVLQTVANNNYMHRPVLFCSAAGFLLAVCVFAGAYLTREKETALTYLDYAEGKK